MCDVDAFCDLRCNVVCCSQTVHCSAFSDILSLLRFYTSLVLSPFNPGDPTFWPLDMSELMRVMMPFVTNYRADLAASCNWVRTYTGYTHYDGFCLVEDGDDRDSDCTRFREYQNKLEV